MLENPKCLFKKPTTDCPLECPQYTQAADYLEMETELKKNKSNELRMMDEIIIAPKKLPNQLNREDFNIFFGCKPEDCLIYRQQVLKIQ